MFSGMMFSFFYGFEGLVFGLALFSFGILRLGVNLEEVVFSFIGY